MKLLLPIACAWAKWQEALILKRGVALSSTQEQTARNIGITHPERVRLLAVEAVPPTNWLLRNIGKKLGCVSDGTIGMTLRYGIFIRAEHWGNRRLLVHELMHVAQYERFGSFWEFLSQYLQECIHPGYPLGDLELEAKRAEDAHYL